MGSHGLLHKGFYLLEFSIRMSSGREGTMYDAVNGDVSLAMAVKAALVLIVQ